MRTFVRSSLTRPPIFTSFRRKVSSCIRSIPPIHQFLPQSVHKPVGSGVQKQPKLVGYKAVAAEAIGFERYLQILDPILCLAPLSVMSVEFIGLIGFVGHHKAGVGALFHHLGFVDDPALDLPASRLVMALGQ
jgi:hypothetical protein